jgi:TPR repeat protein
MKLPRPQVTHAIYVLSGIISAFVLCMPLFAQDKSLDDALDISTSVVSGSAIRPSSIDWRDIRAEDIYERAVSLYRKGKYAKAVPVFEKACGASNANACTAVGYMYKHGEGAKENYARAVRFYRQGCEGGNPEACTNLGMFHYTGNFELAANFLRRGCDGGDGRGCFNLAFMYGHGIGVPKDEARAGELYSKACSAANAPANCGDLWQKREVSASPK